MFQHLPEITESNLKVVLEKEMDYFTNLLRRCTEETKMPDEAIDYMCVELNRTNPLLVKAVRGTVYAVAGELEDDIKTELAWGAGIAFVPGILAILRLLDRALEAQKMEALLTNSQKQ